MLIKKINSKRKNRNIDEQRLIKIKNKKTFLDGMLAKKLNRKNLPNEKGFFGKKIEKLIIIHLLKNHDVTLDFGSSDINKKFLKNYINSGYLIDGHLQIKGSRNNSFSTADLFYFLQSSHLNMLLVNYDIDKQSRSFTITRVYAVQLNPLFFNHIINSQKPFFEYLDCKKNPFIPNNNEKLNRKKNSLIEKKKD